MTRLSEIVKTIKITRAENDYCMGDVWHNQVIDEVFTGVKSNNFNIDIAKFIDETIGYKTYSDGTTQRNWYDHYMSKTQLRKLHAIMVAKSKETLQKRIYAFSNIITSGFYSHLLNRKIIENWVNFCNKHGLEHGLVKVNKVKRYEQKLNKMLQNI